jgi:HK97 gp10 family phage protein
MMADGVEFSIVGLDSLLGKLEAISYDVKRKGGRSALRKAAQVVAEKAREQHATGNILAVHG